MFESIYVQRVIFWIKNFKRIRPRADLSQLGKFRIGNFSTCRILKKSLTTHQILKCNWFVQKQTLMKVFFQKVTFWIFLAHENAIFCSYAFSQKPPISEKNGRKNNFLSRHLKRIRFRNNFFTTRQTLNQEIQNTSEF